METPWEILGPNQRAVILSITFISSQAVHTLQVDNVELLKRQV